MPGGRGGRRQGTPGKGYSNRTDLSTNMAPSTGTNTPASGGVPAPQAPTVSPGNTPPQLFPEDIPKLDDPTARPGVPITNGLNRSQWQFPVQPGNPQIDAIRAAYDANPTPQLQMVLRLMYDRYGRGL